MISGIQFPTIDPIIFNLGPIPIRWYSLAYIFGIIFAYWYLHKIDKYKIFNQKIYDSLLMWSVIGIILGGRLGYILIYNLGYYLDSPIEIFSIWHGGMSFHGGLIGLIIITIIICKKNNIPVFAVMDLLSCSMPIGIFLGRIANFINGELFGRVTSLPWGVIFPDSTVARHPSQLYEAIGEGVFLYVILNLLLFFTNLRLYQGILTGIGIAYYGIVRFFIEFFREPDLQIGYLLFDLTVGQLLSIPMVIAGITIIIIKANKSTFL